MGEAGLYDEEIAADAFRQAEGDLLEAAHLVRAYRSSLPRLAVTEPADPDEMTVLRRIVPASRTPDGPQLLGRTTDYTARILERPDGPARPGAGRRPPAAGPAGPVGQAGQEAQAVAETRRPGRPADLRPRAGSPSCCQAGPHGRARGAGDDPEPFDVTRVPPGPRRRARRCWPHGARGDRRAVGLWYRSILGPDGDIHEVTLGEVRHGRLPLRVIHPLTGEPVEIGQFRVTEAEAIEDLDGDAEDRTRLDVGYGMCFGHNERKAIAMANLDIANRRAGGARSSSCCCSPPTGLTPAASWSTSSCRTT